MSVLADSLVAEAVGPSRYRFARALPEGRGVVFGGHLLAQLAVAAAQADPDKTIKSAHGVFAKTVLPDLPAEVSVDTLQRGRVLSSASASMWQGGKECARALVMLSQAEPDLLRHQSDMPDVAGPDACPREDRYEEDVRVVGGIDRGEPDQVLAPRLSVWIRFPDPGRDQHVSHGQVIQASARFLMGTTMLPHPGVGERMAHREFSTGIVAHTVSFHEEVDLTDWVLLTQESTSTGRGRAYGVGQVFARSGLLVASFSQEAILRHFPAGHSAAGREHTVL